MTYDTQGREILATALEKSTEAVYQKLLEDKNFQQEELVKADYRASGLVKLNDYLRELANKLVTERMTQVLTPSDTEYNQLKWDVFMEAKLK